MLIFVVAVPDGGVLGEDRDALLALEVHRVHHALGDVLVGAERARLPQHRVDERRLAVVDVRHDGDVADVVAPGHRSRVAARDPSRAAASAAHRRFTSCLRVHHDRLTTRRRRCRHDAPPTSPRWSLALAVLGARAARRGGLGDAAEVTTDRGVVQSVGAGQIALRALDGSVVSFAVSADDPRASVNGVPSHARRRPPGLRRDRSSTTGSAPAPVIRAFGKPPVADRPRDRDGARRGRDHASHAPPAPRSPSPSTPARDSASAGVPGRALAPRARGVRRRHSTRPTGRRRSSTCSSARGRERRSSARRHDPARRGRGGHRDARPHLSREATASASIWAARGVEGLLALEQNDIRLAILDLQLPDADGLDLCRAIRDALAAADRDRDRARRGDRPDHRARARRGRLRDEAVLAARARRAGAGRAAAGRAGSARTTSSPRGDIVARARRAHRHGGRRRRSS